MSYRISFIEDDDGAKLEVVAHLEEEFEIADIPLYEGEVPIYSDLTNLVEDILASKLDAIIIDFSFVDRTNDIKFNGAELVEEIQSIMPGFPIFVLSAKLAAESFVPDVNLVYTKKGYLNDPGELHRRIKQQIENYRKEISDSETRLKELLEKRKDDELTLEEEEELIKLDDFLESTQSRTTKVPLSLKKISNFEKLNELILDTKKLIRKIETEGKDAEV